MPYKKRKVYFDVDYASAKAVRVVAVVKTLGVRGAAYNMELKRHGHDNWLVGYFDVTIGAITPLLCEHGPIQTSS